MIEMLMVERSRERRDMKDLTVAYCRTRGIPFVSVHRSFSLNESGRRYRALRPQERQYVLSSLLSPRGHGMRNVPAFRIP
jgi:hypothetical protein